MDRDEENKISEFVNRFFKSIVFYSLEMSLVKTNKAATSIESKTNLFLNNFR